MRELERIRGWSASLDDSSRHALRDSGLVLDAHANSDDIRLLSVDGTAQGVHHVRSNVGSVS